ncbi:MAG: hypothetical protein ACLTDX_06160, partial [[Clostridium] innocuum]
IRKGPSRPADLTFQYQEYDADGVQLTSDWTNIEDTGTSTKTGRFSVYGNGQRVYRFRAVMLDPDRSDSSRSILMQCEESIIAQDTVRLRRSWYVEKWTTIPGRSGTAAARHWKWNLLRIHPDWDSGSDISMQRMRIQNGGKQN